MKQAATKLRQELRQAGAKEAELKHLATIAANLQQLKVADRPAIRRSSRSWRRFMPASLTAVAGLALGIMLVSFSQASLPGSLLYPLKKVSENAAVAIHPEYRGVVMMQRAQAVEKLVADHASSQLVASTLADYRIQAAAYKSSSTNYSVFEFCKANLQQAEAGATGSERQAISQTLASLSDV